MDDGAVPPGYEPVRVLGSGGFGEVVLARHLSLQRLVAVKRIHSVALADAESLERFRREAKLLALLDCTSVVRVYDLVVGPHQAHLVMEYVPGQALSDLIARGPLPAADALRVLHDVADALRAAAEHGIVHRDVKPHNIFVLPDGTAKLGDFGLARAVSDPGIFRTSVGTATGTPAYYPPELGRGEGEPDERSDAYSFAVVAYETLTGRRPYEGTDALALIAAHWRLDPPDPRTMLPGMPPRAAATLLSGLSKDPVRRPLPAKLVSRLEAVPRESWPAVQRLPPRPEPERRTAATVRVHPGAAPSGPVPGKVPGRVPARRKVIGAAATAGLLAVGAAAVWRVSRSPAEAPEPLEVVSVRLSTEPDPAAVRCPEGGIQLDAVFATNGAAGAFTVRWTGPDGERLSEREIEVAAGQHRVETRLQLTLSGPRALRGDATVEVVGGEVSESRPVRYRCGTR